MTKTKAATAEQTSGETLPEFTPGTYYDIELSRPVEFPPGTGSMLRPGQLHHIDGAYCPAFKDAISGAVAVEA